MYVETYTYEDYKRWEGDWIIKGVPLAFTPSPARIHQILSFSFAKLLEKIINEYEDFFVMIEEDYIVDEETILKSDFAVACNEVISPYTINRDEEIKFEIYEKEGVEWLILVYPNILKEKVYYLEDGKYKKVGDFIEGWLKVKMKECEDEIDFDKAFRKIRKYLKRKKWD